MFQFAVLVMTPEGSYVNGRLTVALPLRLRPGHPDGKGAAGRAAEAWDESMVNLWLMMVDNDIYIYI